MAGAVKYDGQARGSGPSERAVRGLSGQPTDGTVSAWELAAVLRSRGGRARRHPAQEKRMVDKKLETPLLDELESGPWPSFVKELKKMEPTKPMVRDLMGQLEQSYEEGQGHWKHGGIVGVRGYGGGVIGRYSDLADEFPG